jgi:hypothetical protein
MVDAYQIGGVVGTEFAIIGNNDATTGMATKVRQPIKETTSAEGNTPPGREQSRPECIPAPTGHVDETIH